MVLGINKNDLIFFFFNFKIVLGINRSENSRNKIGEQLNKDVNSPTNIECAHTFLFHYVWVYKCPTNTECAHTLLFHYV